MGGSYPPFRGKGGLRVQAWDLRSCTALRAGLANTEYTSDIGYMSFVHVTVWFDGACPLCQREIALMRRLDKRGAIHFVDVTSAGAACPIDPALLLARFHAQEVEGPLLHGAAAFAAMWRAIPLLRPLGLAARFPPFLFLMEGAYRGFLRLRPRLQAWAR